MGAVARDNFPPEAMSLKAKMQELRLLLFRPISEELKMTATKLSSGLFVEDQSIQAEKLYLGEIFSCGHLHMKQIVWTLEGC